LSAKQHSETAFPHFAQATAPEADPVVSYLYENRQDCLGTPTQQQVVTYSNHHDPLQPQTMCNR